MALDPARLRLLNPAPARPGRFVLYHCSAARRTRFNPALEHAIQRARELRLPLLVVEPLRLGYPHASVRHHRFVVDGMLDNLAAAATGPVRWLPWLETERGAGKGLLARLAEQAALLVVDDWPGFFHPRMIAAAARLPLRVEAVDGAGLYPVRAAGRAFGRAVDFRRHLQRVLAAHLALQPEAEPLRAAFDLPEAPLPAGFEAPTAERLEEELARLPLDRSVPAAGLAGGARAATERLEAFLPRLHLYPERSHPDAQASSGLSPWLHFGHLGAAEVFTRLVARFGPARFGPTTGAREQSWGWPEAPQAFMDELVTWRELALNGAAFLPGYEAYEATPDWARRSLETHRGDPRPALYDLETLERARTHDPLWNAAQNELRESGRMHNYLRMLWGKRVLEWTEDPAQAFAWLVHLNDRYALDGRDPNTLAGVGWVFGRYDRPWGPERPVFGLVRYMSSENTARKLRLRDYLARWG